MKDKSIAVALAEWGVAAIAILCVAALLLSPVACVINRDREIAEAIKHGADPQDARCALEDSRDSTACVLRAINKTAK